ncbi:uncharacterized protein MEPE_02106 [Melanopsichium pennsylvanicum]|uniref:Conserved oligomeric Golgi complex subunit 1 n=2 Tax=Melanopsichium pennsylvanicum TaxID=63383 RepID=A0AAJ5C4E6_9BASI|nr:conserved hypothetical protein [Melanopsichium pennsylvanicum 4]SNX83399.1 uncharacterized protein MEPE_02106 [Melanopsichium pennsylvanicum]
MSMTSQRQPDSATGANANAPGAASMSTTPTRHGRVRHSWTNASLTSSSGSTSTDLPFHTLPRRPSVSNEASRIFQATGFDPFGTEPDTLFRSLTVKEVEVYERAVRATAHGKQEELRALVGQRYEDLLGTATTIVDMAGSSSQLSQRLNELSEGVRSAALDKEKSEFARKISRRKSFLPTPNVPVQPDADPSSLQQEAVYVLGASLRLIMDAPEYVWKSIEKGKTLQAAWAFMLARATWWDLIDTAPLPDSPSAAQGDEGISSASAAKSLLGVNVKKAFPFIEKQWQSMQPMRKQIVHRAMALLSDTELESMAVVDQLAALVLIDGIKIDQAIHSLLSQRLTAMRRMMHRRRTRATGQNRRYTATGRENEAEATLAHEGKEDRAARTSQTIAQLVNLFARTLQHLLQIFMLPPKSGATTRPLLLHFLILITDAAKFTTSSPAGASPTSERTFLLPNPASQADAPTARQSAAALRALRRRSSHGLPTAEAIEEVASSAEPGRPAPEQPRALRVSTVSVVTSLPSARVLLRLLPPSLWRFAPHLDLESQECHVPKQVLAEVSAWSTKARDIVVGTSGSTAPDTLRFLLFELSDVSELALVRRSLRLTVDRTLRIVTRKLSADDGATDERRQEAIVKVHFELKQLKEAIDAILRERLLHLTEQKLKDAVQELIDSTQQMVFSLRSGSKVRDMAEGALSMGSKVRDMDEDALSMPLDALFHPIEADSLRDRIGKGETQNPTSASRIFAAALQDHICGRSKQVHQLASLYETPLATLSEEVQLYWMELEADESFADVSEAVRGQFENILAASRAEVQKSLVEMLDQPQPSEGTGLSMATSLVIRLIAVLAKDVNDGFKIRSPVKTALERFWRPQLDSRISSLLKKDIVNQVGSEASVSPLMLTALAIVSESIVCLGPALAGPELAQQVRDVLETVVANGFATDVDADAIRALLACDATSLSKYIAANINLYRIRLTLSPLVSALAMTASGWEKGEGGLTTGMILTSAEPASASVEKVRPILTVPRGKTGRFSPLPVR